MAYEKTTWVKRVVEFPDRYEVTDLGGGLSTIEPSPGTVTAAGTAMTEDRFNNLETQYDEAVSDLSSHDTSDTAHGRTGGVLPLTQLPALAKDYIWAGDSEGRPAAIAFNVSATVIPSGVMMEWAGATASVPSGWLLADGSAVSRSTYAALFAAVGTLWGAGNGSTTFNLPNTLSKMAYGVANGSTNPGATGGAVNKTTAGHDHTVQQDSGHGHSGTTGSDGSHDHTLNKATVQNSGSGTNCAYSMESGGSHTHSFSTGTVYHTHTATSATDSISDIRPPFYVVGKIIKI